MGIFKGLMDGLKNAGSEYFAKQSSKKEFLETQLTQYLKEHLQKTNVDEFIDSFEKNVNIVTLIPQEELEFIKKLAKDDPNVPTIKRNILRNLSLFNKEWVLDWIFKEEPNYYQVIATHPKRDEFENWIAAQIQNMGKFIADF